MIGSVLSAFVSTCMAFATSWHGHRPSEADDSVALTHLSNPDYSHLRGPNLLEERKPTCNYSTCCVVI